MTLKLDYFEGMVNSINKRHGFEFTVMMRDDQIVLFSKKGRVFGTTDPRVFESALKSLKKEGVISHYLFEERQEYRAFIKDAQSRGLSPKQAHRQYFENLL